MPASSLLKLCVSGALGAGLATGAYVTGKGEGARTERAKTVKRSGARGGGSARALCVPAVPLASGTLPGSVPMPVEVGGFGPVAMGGVPADAPGVARGHDKAAPGREKGTGREEGPLPVPEPLAIALFGLATGGVFARMALMRPLV